MYFKKTKPIKMLFSNPDMFWHMYAKWPWKVASAKFFKKIIKPTHYAGRKVTPDYEGNEIMKDLILSNKPFLVGRPGASEIFLFIQSDMLRKGLRTPAQDQDYKGTYINTGIFPRTVDFINKYTPFAEDALSQCDLLNVSYCVMEDYIYKTYMKKDAQLTYIRSLDYWRFKEPWTKALKGKKVVVVSPFADTIKKQYEIREKLYEDTEILPEFTLYTVKAVQTGGNEKDDRFADWFEALEYMYNEVM